MSDTSALVRNCPAHPGLVFATAAEWVGHQRDEHGAALGLVGLRPAISEVRWRATSRRGRRWVRRRHARRDGTPRRALPSRPYGPVGRPPPEPRRGPRVAEGRPWEEFNSDGSLNLGSYAVGAAEGMVLLAHDLLREHASVDTPDFGGFPPPNPAAPTPGQIKALARRLLEAADRAQAGVRDDGRFDRMDHSHVRARAAIRAAVQVHPVPWGQVEAYDEWVDAMAGYAKVLLRATVELVR